MRSLPSPSPVSGLSALRRRLSGNRTLAPIAALWRGIRLGARLLGVRILWPSLRYQQDGLATEHNADFCRDARFARAYALGRATGSWRGREIQWRAYVACWATEHACRLPGDMVECGVYRGGLSRTVMEYVGFERVPKTFFLLDTFRGIPKNRILPEERRLGRGLERYEECYEDVVRTFARYPNVTIIRGPVPDTLPQVTAERVCYLSLDMNSAAAEVAAIEFFWDRLVPGAIVLLDDYGFRDYAPQKHAMDAFAAERGVSILSLPTGQGLIIKV
jgi:O-methyltransferase